MSDINNKPPEKQSWQYLVNFVIDVKRTDNKKLTDNENDMVQEMRAVTEKVIAHVMHKYGYGKRKNLERKTIIY